MQSNAISLITIFDIGAGQLQPLGGSLSSRIAGKELLAKPQ
jgi:hypothetical protein